MTCPHHNRESTEADSSANTEAERRIGRGPDERSFTKAALKIGGSSALSTALGLFGMSGTAAADEQTPSVTITERGNRQHSWNAYEREAQGTFLPPEHHLLLFLDYRGPGEPTADHRTDASEAFDRLERAFGWHHEGVLFTVGYSSSYFDRFDEDPPRGIQPGNGAIPRMFTAQQLIDGPTIPILNVDGLQPTESESEEERSVDLTVTLPREDPVADDDYDACIHLASDHAQNLLAAEAALWGFPNQDRTELNGVDFTGANLDGIFTRPTEYPDRRIGFTGSDNIEENLEKRTDFDEETITETGHGEAELSMGYNDLYKNSMPREDNVTMLEDHRFLPGPPNWQPPGVFANGSIMHASHLHSDLDGWYGDNDDSERRHRMFSPHHTEADVGAIGENLAPRGSNAPTAEEKPPTERLPMRDLTNDVRDVAERTEEDFDEEDRHIGHAQKTARARAQLEAHFRNEDGGAPIDIPQRDDPVAQERDDDLSGHDATNQTVETGFLRRDFNTVDGGQPGTHFVALQAFSIYLAYTRHAMNGVDWDSAMLAQPTIPDGSLGFEHDASDGSNPEHGILEYVTTLRRGNFILPPIRQRALPHARAIKLVEENVAPETGLGGAPLPPYVEPDGTFGFERSGGTYRVEVPIDGIDPESVRFGFYRDVNAGGGAAPAGVETGSDATTFVFAVDDTRLPEELEREAADTETPDDGTVRARLYAERGADRRPVFGTTTVGEGA
jgi:hypothetical protein